MTTCIIVNWRQLCSGCKWPIQIIFPMLVFVYRMVRLMLRSCRGVWRRRALEGPTSPSARIRVGSWSPCWTVIAPERWASMSSRSFGLHSTSGRSVFKMLHEYNIGEPSMGARLGVCTVVSRVSAHGCLSITGDFGPHGRFSTQPGYNKHTFVWRLVHWPHEMRYMCAYPGVGYLRYCAYIIFVKNALI